MSDDPVKSMSWPKTLAARVVEPGSKPCIHGYDVEDDLARHYGFGDVVLLALTGELPSDRVSRLFARLLVLLSPAYAGAASTHAGSLLRVCGSSDTAVFSIVTAIMAETFGAGEVSHLAWEEGPLKEALGSVMREEGIVPGFGEKSPAAEAVTEALGACGLGEAWQRSAALIVAALPTAMAEARSWERGRFKVYPMELPYFRYEEEDD